VFQDEPVHLPIQQLRHDPCGAAPIIHVFSGICGVYIIFKLQDIISGMIGINGDDSNISQMTEKLQQKMAGDMVKV
jgi:hypothetical protein